MLDRFFRWLLAAFWGASDTKTTAPTAPTAPAAPVNTPDWTAYGQPDAPAPRQDAPPK